MDVLDNNNKQVDDPDDDSEQYVCNRGEPVNHVKIDGDGDGSEIACDVLARIVVGHVGIILPVGVHDVNIKAGGQPGGQ